MVMKKQRSSVDGFIPRRQMSQTTMSDKEPVPALGRGTKLHTGGSMDDVNDMSTRPEATSLGTSSIRESLQGIDEETPEQQPVSKKERRRLRKERRKNSKKRRIIKRIIIVIAIIIIGIIAYVGINAMIASNNIFHGGVFGFIQRQPLKQDENGRSNFLIFGTAEDDEGGKHGGANLTDSLMVMSVDQERKNAYMISIPRDLWVDYGQACLSGYQGKANEIYSCGSNDGQNEAAGAAALQKKIGSILGLDIQYYIHLNFTAVVEAVDAVGGVDVVIESNPKGVGILDRNFDWKCGYKCHYVKYNDGQKAHLDGEHALALARARNAQGGYGLAAGNFDREKNQQKIIKSLREKALSVGTLTNLGKVTGLINALGKNLRTNIETKEIQTLMTLASEIKNEDIKSLTLVDEDKPLVTTGMVGTASVVRPVAGLFDYSSIKAYIAKASSNNPVVKEGAKVVVLNGSGISGVARTESEKLMSKGYTISVVDDAPKGTYEDAEVYQLGEGNTATASALAERYGVTIKTTRPPVAVADDVSFVVIIGKARESQN